MNEADTGHTSWVTAASTAPDGTWLATTSDDQTPSALGGISALISADSPLEECVWRSSGHLLAAADDAVIYLFAFRA